VNTIKPERRNLRRYSAPGFSISLTHVQQQIYYQESIEPSTVDFNHIGMAINTQCYLKIGDELKVVITDEFNRSVAIIGCVCNRAKTTNGYRSGIHFPDQNNSTETKQTLIKMEQQLCEALQCEELLVRPERIDAKHGEKPEQKDIKQATAAPVLS
jgi:hypothetical protein